MASAYELHTLSDQSRHLIIEAVQKAIPGAGEMRTDRLYELLALLRDAHKIVLKYKHVRAA